MYHAHRPDDELHAKFATPDKAASYVGSGLAVLFPNQPVEVVFHFANTRIRHAVCKTHELGHVLEQLCRRFPNASVDYHPENTDGFLAEIRCRCPEHAFGTCCSHGSDRPHADVYLNHRMELDAVVQSSSSPLPK